MQQRERRFLNDAENHPNRVTATGCLWPTPDGGLDVYSTAGHDPKQPFDKSADQ
jgi:hypothetical protein